jgi:tetratricopeptide (TPR) repeat protein
MKRADPSAIVRILLPAILVLSSTVFSQSPIANKRNFVVVTRPVDVSASKDPKGRWFGAFAEEELRFRLTAVRGIEVIPADTMAHSIHAYPDLTIDVNSEDYMAVARRFRAAFMVNQKFELTDNGRLVQYYAEITALPSGKLLKAVDASFPVGESGKHLDSASVVLISGANVTIPPDLVRFFKLDAVSSDPRLLREFGDIIITERFSGEDNAQQAADMYDNLVARDPSVELAYLLGARAYARARKFKKASDLYRSILDVMPEYGPLYLEYAHALRASRNMTEAIRVVELGESKLPGNLPLLSEKAQILEAQGQPARAEQAYIQILSIDKNNTDAMVFLARLNNDRGKPADALRRLDPVLRVTDASADVLVEKGRALSLLQKPDDALLAFGEAMRKAPTDPRPLIGMGDIRVMQKNSDLAVDVYQQAAKLLPNDWQAHRKAAQALQMSGDGKKALELLRSVEGRFSTNTELQKELGLLELSQGDPINARRHLESCFTEQKADPRVLVGLGDVYLAARQLDDAYKMYTAALPVAQDKNACRLALARLYVAKNTPAQATTYLNDILASDPNYPGANGLAGDVKYALGNKKGALASYVRERDLAGGNVRMQSRIATVYYENGAWDKAEPELLELIKQDPATTAHYYRLGVVYLRLKNKDKAKYYLGEAAKVGQPDKDQLHQMAQAFAFAGVLERAAETYRACLDLSPQWETVLVELAAVYTSAKRDKELADVNVRLFALNNEKYKPQLVDAGDTYLRLGLKVEAKQAYTLFLDKKYSNPAVNARLAQLEYEAKNYPRVISLLEGVGGQWATDEATQMLLAESYFASGQMPKAIAQASKVLAARPQQARATELAALARDKQGNTAEAIKMYGAFLTFPASANTPHYAFHLAELYEKAGQKQYAVERYARNVEQYPKDMRNYERLADLLFAQKSWVDCERALRKAVELPDAQPRLRKMLAQCLAAQGSKREDAVSSYQQYLTMVPADSAAWLDLGTIFFGQKDYTRAVAPLTQAVKYMPKNTDCHYMLGVSQFQTNMPDEAAVHLKQVRAVRKDDLAVVDMLARCYRTRKDTAGLIAVLRDWRALDARSFDVRVELGSLLLARNATDEAASVVAEAVKLNATDPVTQRLLLSIYEKQGNEKLRIQAILRLVEIAPADPDAHYQLARYYLATQDEERAAMELGAVIGLSSAYPEARYDYGMLLYRQAKTRQAFEQFSDAARIDGANALYQAYLAFTASLLGKTDSAVSAADRALSVKTTNLDILYMTAQVYSKSGQTDKARQLLSDALAINDSSVACHQALGEVYVAKGSYKLAVKSLMKAWERGGYNESVVLSLGRALSFDRKYTEAKDFLKLILTKNPASDRAVYELVHVLCAEDKSAEAAQAIADFEKKSPRTGWTHLALGEVAETRIDLDAAWIAYSVALKLLPGEPRAQTACGRVCLARRQYEESIEYFGNALSKDPNNPGILVNLAEAYEGQNNVETALELCKSVAERMPDDPESFYVMTRIYAAQNDHVKALAAIKQGLVQNPTNAMLLYSQAGELRAAGQSAAAIQSYESAVRFGGIEAFVDAYRYIGAMYSELKNVEKAKEYFRKYLNAGGTSIEVKDQLKALGG